MKIEPIEIWTGCDPKIEEAIIALSMEWRPHTLQSRRYPILKLLRELIDPAWIDLCHRTPAMSREVLLHAWLKTRLSTMMDTTPRISPGLTETSLLSAIAKGLGIAALVKFIDEVARAAMKRCSGTDFDNLAPTLDSLRELALRCQSKTSKPKSFGKFGKVPLLHGMITCRACEKPTTLSARLSTAGDASTEADVPRLSSTYCRDHSPNKKSVTWSKYKKVRRSQQTFETELERLELQSWERPATSRAKSGNPLLDEFFQQLSRCEGLTIDAECGASTRADLETRLRKEARRLVDQRMTDRKKEMVALLSAGMNPPTVAKYLGLSRQAVSKALPSIHPDYRFDLGCKAASTNT